MYFLFILNKKYTDCPKFESVSMKFCKYCGICENDELAIFCALCGKKFSEPKQRNKESVYSKEDLQQVIAIEIEKMAIVVILIFWMFLVFQTWNIYFLTQILMVILVSGMSLMLLI